MEKENIVNKTSEELMKISSFTQYKYTPPYKIPTIKISPIAPIKLSPKILLTKDILDKIGVIPEDKSIFGNLLQGCNACGTCKALSKQTLNEINDEDIKSATDDNNEPKKMIPIAKDHLMDEVKKEKFEQEWKKLKKYSVKVPKTTFITYYQQNGNMSIEQWR